MTAAKGKGLTYRRAWAIITGIDGELYPFIGDGSFDYDLLLPWQRGLGISLFAMEATAREHLGKVKGSRRDGRYPKAKVVPVIICITEISPPVEEAAIGSTREVLQMVAYKGERVI